MDTPEEAEFGQENDLPSILRPFGGGKPRNWADDEGVCSRIKTEIIPLINAIRDRRAPLNEMWRRLGKVWTLEHENQAYLGRSNLFIPAGKKGAETLVPQFVSATFPGEDFFDIISRIEDPTFNQNAVYLKSLLAYQINKQAKVRLNAERFYRQLAMIGNSPVKVLWHKKQITQRRRRNAMSDMDVPTVLYNGPRFESIMMDCLYYWPETVADPEDAEIVFEDMAVSSSSIAAKARAGIYNAAAADRIHGSGERTSARAMAQMAKLTAQGMTDPVDDPGRSAVEGWQGVDLTEIWLDFDPLAPTKSKERYPVPFVITICGGEVLRARTNPFWHQRPPYLLGRMGTLVGRFYGTGYVESIRDLQTLLNDQVNQSMDCATYALNPIVLTNPNLIIGELPGLEPGVQWLVNDINQAVKTITPPMEPINAASVLTSQTMSWMQDFIGAPPVLTGGAAPGRAFKTATGVGTAQKNAVIPLQEVVRLTEKQVWEQMLYLFHSLTEQYADDQYRFEASGGAQLVRLDPDQLRGDFLYDWLASTQTDNKQVKGSQIMELLPILTSPAMTQMLAANGLRVNPGPLIKRLYTEVYGFRDVDSVLVQAGMVPPPGMPMNVQGNPGQGAQPSPPAPPMNLPEELNNNGDFLNVRQGADITAAATGGSNNQEAA